MSAAPSGKWTVPVCWPRSKALARLRRREDVEMFAAVPHSLPGALGLRVRQLRLMSTGLTGRSSLRWTRLRIIAVAFLDLGRLP
ncbi:hypothetical protein ACH47Z_32850 [Streptomyces sp. NPDC020192]|uniref:hypothetical protein n=1 Tax=Streptomyces sp. NPDC020192 TaxID=3365066 RepID=UPI00378B1297